MHLTVNPDRPAVVLQAGRHRPIWPSAGLPWASNVGFDAFVMALLNCTCRQLSDHMKIQLRRCGHIPMPLGWLFLLLAMACAVARAEAPGLQERQVKADRKSTRLNSSHTV